MSAGDVISKPKVPDTVAHLDPDVVVETLSRHGVNVSDAASELGVASADLRRCCGPIRSSLMLRLRSKSAVWISLRRIFSRRLYRMILAVGTRLRCSPFATAIALGVAAGSRRARAQRN
jgi:hypothetical protein